MRAVHQFNEIPGEADAAPDFLAPVSVLPEMVSAPRRIEVYDRMGFATVKVTDGFGNEICMQERGDWSDWDAKVKGAADKMKNPSLFYRVKNEVCGHLK